MQNMRVPASWIRIDKTYCQKLEEESRQNQAMDCFRNYPAPPYTDWFDDRDAPDEEYVINAVCARDPQTNMQDMLRRFIRVATEEQTHSIPLIAVTRQCLPIFDKHVHATSSKQDRSDLLWHFRLTSNWQVAIPLKTAQFFVCNSAYKGRAHALITELPVNSMGTPPPPPIVSTDYSTFCVQSAQEPLTKGEWHKIQPFLLHQSSTFFNIIPALNARLQESWPNVSVSSASYYVASDCEIASYASRINRWASEFFSHTYGLFPMAYNRESAIMASFENGEYRILHSIPRECNELLLVRACSPFSDIMKSEHVIPFLKLKLVMKEATKTDFDYRKPLARLAAHSFFEGVPQHFGQWGNAWDKDEVWSYFKQDSPYCDLDYGSIQLMGNAFPSHLETKVHDGVEENVTCIVKRFPVTQTMLSFAEQSVGYVQCVLKAVSHDAFVKALSRNGATVWEKLGLSKKKNLRVYNSPVESARQQRMLQGVKGACILCVWMPKKFDVEDDDCALVGIEHLNPVWAVSLGKFEPNKNEPLENRTDFPTAAPVCHLNKADHDIHRDENKEEEKSRLDISEHRAKKLKV